MVSTTIEHLALAVVAIVLVVSVVQAVQLAGLNEKVSQQNTALAALAGSGKLMASAAPSNSNPAPQQSSAPASSTMVGGC